jgi:hypothetical protein
MIFGDLVDRNHGTALLAELADQLAVRAVDTQGNFWLVIGQHIKRRQRRIDDDRSETDDQTTCRNQQKHQ